MKILTICLTVALTLVYSGKSFSEVGLKKGTVEHIRIHDTNHVGWEPPLFWFTLNGVTKAGNCSAWQGNVLFVADSDQMLTMILTAQMGKQEIAVHYNDLIKTNGYCRATFITTGNPPPIT